MEQKLKCNMKELAGFLLQNNLKQINQSFKLVVEINSFFVINDNTKGRCTNPKNFMI